eukprot:COSAG05_NODE_528_length_8915_cov_26.504651_12_plen_161_part_00
MVFSAFAAVPHSLIAITTNVRVRACVRAHCSTGLAEFPIIDWQMISAGPAGTDLVQALQLTFADISDYDRIFEMIGIYHAALSPEFAKDYTLEMATEDFQILMAFALAGMCGAIGPYTEGLKDDLENDLWTLCEFMIPRIGKCNTSLKVLEYVKGIEARV